MRKIDETLLVLNRLIRSMQRLKNTVGDKFLKADDERLTDAIYIQNKYAKIEKSMRVEKSETKLSREFLSIGLSFEEKGGVECINVNFYIYLIWAVDHLIVSHWNGKKFIDLKLQRIYTFEHLEKWFELNVATTEYHLAIKDVTQQDGNNA